MIINIRNSKKDNVIIRVEDSLKEEFCSRILPNFSSIRDAYNGYNVQAYYISFDDLANLILSRETLNVIITVGDVR